MCSAARAARRPGRTPSASLPASSPGTRMRITARPGSRERSTASTGPARRAPPRRRSRRGRARRSSEAAAAGHGRAAGPSASRSAQRKRRATSAPKSAGIEIVAGAGHGDQPGLGGLGDGADGGGAGVGVAAGAEARRACADRRCRRGRRRRRARRCRSSCPRARRRSPTPTRRARSAAASGSATAAGSMRRAARASGGRLSKSAVESCSISSQRPCSAASTGCEPEARPFVEAKKAEAGRRASQQVSTTSKGTSAGGAGGEVEGGRPEERLRAGACGASRRARGRSRQGVAPRSGDVGGVAEAEREQRALAVPALDRLHDARDLRGGAGQALAVRDREGAGVGADDGEDLDAGAVEAGDPGDAGDAEVGEARQQAGEGRLGGLAAVEAGGGRLAERRPHLGPERAAERGEVGVDRAGGSARTVTGTVQDRSLLRASGEHARSRAGAEARACGARGPATSGGCG